MLTSMERNSSQVDSGWAVVSREDRSRAAKLVADAWSDQSLADRFRLDPQAVLREYGIQAPQGASFELPPCPTDDILDERLAADWGLVAATNDGVMAAPEPSRCGCRGCGCRGCHGCRGCGCRGCGCRGCSCVVSCNCVVSCAVGCC